MYKILTIDDEKEITRVLDIFLTKKGFTVLAANSCAEGLKILEKEKADLLIVDKKMPKMTGDEFLKTLRGKGFTMPSIMLTGSIALGGLPPEECKESCDTVLTKPLDLDILLEAVKEKLGIK